MAYIYASGTLTGTTAVVNVPNTPPSSTAVVLNSSAGGRAIQFSFDGGATFYPAVTPTYSETGQIVYVLTFPVTTIKLTGAANDTYSIL